MVKSYSGGHSAIFQPALAREQAAIEANKAHTQRKVENVLDNLWHEINSLGTPDSACTTPEELAFNRAIDLALAIVKQAGGMDKVFRAGERSKQKMNTYSEAAE
jgi:hypothetical protein